MDDQRDDGASLLPGSPVLRVLRRRAGVELGVHLSDADDGGPVVRPRTAELGGQDTAGRRYDLLGTIAEGGMGIVLKGRDKDLGRDVAIKVLRREAAEDDALAYRFVEEGQIGGQLQHPGIVPVYELGLLDRRRPFLAMKLVKGKTLAALLKARRSPAEDRARYLQVFERVAQTMAYVHARRVIHRDLKPSNVMIGAFGEVQVMDFGLAKVLQVDEREAEPLARRTTIETARAGTPACHSRPGSVMGTYAYMPPEQANGEVERLDERCDVFALGAVLCEILTGKPPYTGSLETVRRLARDGRLEPARERLAGCGADEAVVALALRCLDPDPAERFADARAVADAMAAYLASLEERARRSLLAAARSQARAAAALERITQERRARRLGLAFAAALVVLVVGGGAVGRALASASERRGEELRQRVSAELERSMRLRGQAAAGAPDLVVWNRALDAARSAQRIAAAGPTAPEPELERRVAETVRALEADVARLEADLERAGREARLVARLDEIETEIGNHFDFRQQERLYASAFAEFGLDPWSVDAEEAAELVRASGIGPRLLRAFNLWASALNALPEQEGRSARLNRIALLAETDPGTLRIREIGRAGDREAAYEIARSGALSAYSPTALLSLAEHLAFGLDDKPAAVAVLEVARDEYPDDLWIRLQLAQHLRDLDEPRLAEALREYTAALALRDDEQMWMHVGVVHMQMGRWREALAAYEEAIERDPEYVEAINNVGLVLGKLGDAEGALAMYTRCAALAPDDPTYEFNRGNMLAGLGLFEEAAVAYERAVQLGDPQEAVCLDSRARALLELGRVDEAIALTERVIAENPRYTRAYGTLVDAYDRKGEGERILPLLEEALEHATATASAAIEASHTLLQLERWEDAVIFGYAAVERFDAPELWHNLGVALRRCGRPREAIDALERTFRSEAGYYDVHNEIGICHFDLGQLDEACAAYERCLALAPEYVHAWHNLGNAHDRAGRPDDAIAAYAQAVELDPEYADSWEALGIVHGRRGELGPALEAITRAAELGLPRAHYSRGVVLAQLGRHADAAEAYLEAERAGEVQHAWNNAGWNLITCGRLVEAVEALEAGLEREPEDGGMLHNLGWALFDLGELEASADAMEVAVRLLPRSDSAHAMYGIALQWLGRFEEARSAFRQALALSTTDEARERRAGYLREIEAVLALEPDLDDYVAGTLTCADAARAVALARLAFARGRHAAAARFFGRAFELDPATRDDLEEEHLVDAARAACRALGEGVPDSAARRELSARARGWLARALELHRASLDSADAADRHRCLKATRRLQAVDDFASVRAPVDERALEADERDAWRALWRRVERLETEAAERAPGPLPAD